MKYLDEVKEKDFQKLKASGLVNEETFVQKIGTSEIDGEVLYYIEFCTSEEQEKAYNLLYGGDEIFVKKDTVDTPVLDKIIEIQEQSQLCGKFLEYLQTKYAMFDKKIKRESPFMSLTKDSGDYINTEKLLAEFFGVDLEEADRERRLLLDQEIQYRKE